jgi:hypothetical protein
MIFNIENLLLAVLEKMKKDYLKIVLIFIISLIIVLIVGCLWWYFPQYQIDKLGSLTNSTIEMGALENQYRLTVVQTLGGLAVIAGLIFTYMKILALKDGQVTERFTRAIECLGKDQLTLKLGGIYALERIAKESKTDYWQIMEILTAYVRTNSTIDEIDSKSKKEALNKSDIPNLSTDIQTVITVLGRRYRYENKNISEIVKFKCLDISCLYKALIKLNICKPVNEYLYENDMFKSLDLTRTCLNKARLRGAHFENVIFSSAHFQWAILNDAHLERAHLAGAHLEHAVLVNAHLQKADLEGAFLEGAFLQGSRLRGAKFKGAHLKREDFVKAHHEGAHFKGAIIDGVVYNEDDLYFN